MPRGNLSLVIGDASEIADAKVGILRDLLDGMSDDDLGTGAFGEGRNVPLRAYVDLLRNDPQTQERAAATYHYMRPNEQRQLRKIIESTSPTNEGLPPENTAIPLSGEETAALRRGTGG